MKVLMFGWEFPPHITGGLGTACYGLTKALSSLNVEMIFVVPRLFGDENAPFMRLRNASDIEIATDSEEQKLFWEKLQYIEVNSRLIPYLDPELYSKLFENTLLNTEEIKYRIFSKKFSFSGEYGPNLMEEVSRYAVIASAIALQNNFDVIHSHDWLTYPAGIAAKEVSGKPLVIHVHATEFDRSGENINQNVYDIERKGMLAADRIITVSNLTRRIVIEKYGISEDKVFTVYNGVQTGNFSEPDFTRGVSEKIVTFLGRITYQKGPDYFVEAANLVINKDPNVRFVMAGSGDMLTRMIKRVAKLGIADKFHFTGFLKGADVHRMFAISDVYVMPSVSEPFGISPLEAMTANVPVIISKQSGVSEILNHAIKIDFWDIDEMADSIYGLLHYEGLTTMFKKYGRSEVEQLKWDHAAFRVKEIYESLV
ncbi:MAG TPA: glycosyltransferase family 4 protein [Bacteroidales bacterium]|nr:glycosyltransferase family 4 protein [Bacteroidales bacterium]